MAKTKRSCTITMSPEGFEGLRKIAVFNSYKPDSTLTSPSAIIDYLAERFIKDNAEVIQMIADNERHMRELVKGKSVETPMFKLDDTDS